MNNISSDCAKGKAAKFKTILMAETTHFDDGKGKKHFEILRTWGKHTKLATIVNKITTKPDIQDALNVYIIYFKCIISYNLYKKFYKEKMILLKINFINQK